MEIMKPYILARMLGKTASGMAPSDNSAEFMKHPDFGVA